jgi:uncharacterized protein YbgA (DUF1722 family)/uncharacterized protein YbbK (DUF523 family)
MSTMKHEQQNEIFPIRVGISQCLLGAQVRYDGGHKKDLYLTDVLGKYFDWIPVCPELEVGMGVPRESVRLVLKDNIVRMVGTSSGTEWTTQMTEFSKQRLQQLQELSLCGFIFKSKSPSCGMERVPLYSPNGTSGKSGRGIFSDAFMKHFPLIPVEEEGRLNDARLRENFIVRVFAYHRLQLLLQHFNRNKLIEFHTKHKYLLLAHSEQHYRKLGNVVGTAKDIPPKQLKETYATLFMECLTHKTTAKKNVNVLQHMFGFLKEYLSDKEKSEILSVIDDYHRELVPLIVPMTLLKHYINIHPIEYLREQLYLNPHPKELMLRNRV